MRCPRDVLRDVLAVPLTCQMSMSFPWWTIITWRSSTSCKIILRTSGELEVCSSNGLGWFALNMVEMTELLMERKADYSQVCCWVFSSHRNVILAQFFAIIHEGQPWYVTAFQLGHQWFHLVYLFLLKVTKKPDLGVLWWFLSVEVFDYNPCFHLIAPRRSRIAIGCSASI